MVSQVNQCLIESVALSNEIVQRRADGTAVVVFPPGFIELATGDELHFDCDGLRELLNVNPGRKSKE